MNRSGATRNVVSMNRWGNTVGATLVALIITCSACSREPQGETTTHDEVRDGGMCRSDCDGTDTDGGPKPSSEGDAGAPPPNDAGQGDSGVAATDAAVMDAGNPPTDAAVVADAGPDATTPGPDATTPGPQDAAMTGLPLGGACDADGQCESGECDDRDGVCCDTVCSGGCRSCLATWTGGSDGQCASITSGADPYAACAVDPANPCGAQDLGCNGEVIGPACLVAAVGTVCEAARCEAGHREPARLCDGLGTCLARGAATDCGRYACDDTQATCRSDCTGDADCQPGSVCTSGGACVLDPNASQVLWLKSWIDAYLEGTDLENALHTTVYGLETGGPTHDIYFVERCIGDSFVLPGCGPYPTLWLNRVNADGSGHDYAGIDSTSSYATHLDVDAMGRVLVGYHIAMYGPNRLDVAFVRSWDAALDRRWTFSARFGETHVRGLVVDPLGPIAVRIDSDFYSDFDPNNPTTFPVDYGGGPLDGPAFVSWDADGQFLWQHNVAFTPLAAGGGQVFGVTGDADTLLSLGCTPPVGGPMAQTLVAFDSTGQCAWLAGLSDDGSAPTMLDAHGDSGDVVMAMLSDQATGPAAGGLPAGGQRDLVLARLAPDGSTRWAQRWPAAALESVQLAVADNGQALLFGSMTPGALDVGGGAIDAPQASLFFARIDSDGRLLGHLLLERPAGAGPLDPHAYRFAAASNGDALLLTTDRALDLHTDSQTAIHRSPPIEVPGEVLVEVVDMRLARLRIGAP